MHHLFIRAIIWHIKHTNVQGTVKAKLINGNGLKMIR